MNLDVWMSPLADSGWARLRTARGATGLIGKWAAGRRETMARCGTGFAILAAPLSSRSDAEVAGIEHGLRCGLKAHSPIHREPLGSTTRPATTGIGRIRHFPPAMSILVQRVSHIPETADPAKTIN